MEICSDYFRADIYTVSLDFSDMNTKDRRVLYLNKN